MTDYDAIHHALAGDDSDAAHWAIDEVGKLTAEDIPFLERLLQDDDFFVLEIAGCRYAELKGPDSFDLIMDVLSRGIQHDFDSLVGVFSDVLADNRRLLAPRITPLLCSSDPELRQKAAWAIGFVARYVPAEPLIRAADDPSSIVRRYIAYALGESRDRGAKPALKRLFEDPDEGVRSEAAEASTGRLKRAYREVADWVDWRWQSCKQLLGRHRD